MIIRAPYGKLLEWMESNISAAEFSTPLNEYGAVSAPDEGDRLASGPGWFIGFNAHEDGWEVRLDQQKHEVAFLLRWS